MLSQSYSMEPRLGRPKLLQQRKSRLSLTTALGEFYRLDGQTLSQTKSFGNVLDNRKWNRKFYSEDGDGLVTHYGNQYQASLDRPSHGIHRGRGREVDQEIPGDVT